jgi:hypothetical protein
MGTFRCIVPLQNCQYISKHCLQGVRVSICALPLRGPGCAIGHSRMSSGEFAFCGRRRGGRRRQRRRGEGAVGGGHVDFWVLLAMREVMRGMERAQGGRSRR